MNKTVKNIHLHAATSVVAFGTFLSRITGLLREMVIAAVFGATNITDAYFVAYRIPNTLRRLFAEGGATIAVLPVYNDLLSDPNAAIGSRRQYEEELFTLWRIVLMMMTILGIILSPWLVQFFASGFTKGTPIYHDTVISTQLLFPFIYFISLGGIAMGILNALGYFFAPAFGQVFLNLGVIVCAFIPLAWFGDHLPKSLGLTIGTLIGVGVFWSMQRRTLRVAGVSLKWRFSFSHPRLKETLILLLPVTLSLAVYQLQVMISTQFASYLPEGTISYLYYADRLIQFPLGSIGTAIGTVALPLLSQVRLAGGDFNKTLGQSVSWTLFLVVPATVGLVLLGQDIVQLLFQRGIYTDQDTYQTYLAVLGYSFGLIPAALNRVLLSCYYANKNTTTPLKITGVTVVVQLLASWLLLPYGVFGLGLATSLTTAAQTALILINLRSKSIYAKDTLSPLLKTGLINIMMALCLYVLTSLSYFHGATAILRVGTGIIAAGAIFILMATFLKHPEWLRLSYAVKARIKRKFPTA